MTQIFSIFRVSRGYKALSEFFCDPSVNTKKGRLEHAADWAEGIITAFRGKNQFIRLLLGRCTGTKTTDSGLFPKITINRS